MTGGKFELRRFASASELARIAAQEWLQLLAASADAATPHLAVLSGGRIARAFYQELLASTGKQRGLWNRVHFFFADERCVPPGDSESNFFLADTLLFQPLAIAREKIHRLAGEIEPAAAARKASEELNSFGQPLDLVILGLGEDGHIASLFPNAGSPPGWEDSSYFPVDDSPKPPPRRLTLGYGPLVSARRVWTLVSGAGKELALTQSTEPHSSTPLGRLIAQREQTVILTDIQNDIG